jgi:hypothetical protein
MHSHESAPRADCIVCEIANIVTMTDKIYSCGFHFFVPSNTFRAPAACSDNWKSGVKKPCYYEPGLNCTYNDLAIHYGVGILSLVRSELGTKLALHIALCPDSTAARIGWATVRRHGPSLL